MRLSWVNRYLHQAVSAYIEDAFAIEPRLAIFFPDALEFRNLQARTGTLLSGQFALRYFDRKPTPSTLDLYVHPHQRREVGRWLLQHAGYTFGPTDTQDPDFEIAVAFKLRMRHQGGNPGLAATFTFIKAGIDGETVTLRIIVGKRGPMEMILSSLSSKSLTNSLSIYRHSLTIAISLTIAHEMNIISFEKAYCLFPPTSVEPRGWVRNRLPDDISVEPEEFGGNVRIPFHHPSGVFEGISPGLRWLGDPHTWVVPLEIHCIKPHPPLTPYSSPLLADPVAITSFDVRCHPVDGVSISFFILHSDALRYCYVVGTRSLINHLRLIASSLAWSNYYNVVCRLDDWS